MRTPLLRHQIATYRASQRRRALKFALYAGAFLTAGAGFGAIAATSPAAALALFFAGALIGYGLHSLTRPML